MRSIDDDRLKDSRAWTAWVLYACFHVVAGMMKLLEGRVVIPIAILKHLYVVIILFTISASDTDDREYWLEGPVSVGLGLVGARWILSVDLGRIVFGGERCDTVVRILSDWIVGGNLLLKCSVSGVRKLTLVSMAFNMDSPGS